MHLLHVTDGIYPISIGGMQKYAAELTKALLEVDEELSITLVFTDYQRQYRPDDEKKIYDYIGDSTRLKLIYVPFPQTKPQLPLHYIKESKIWSREVFKAVGDPQQFDIIYAHGFSGVAKPKDWKTPMVENLHGLNMFQTVFGWKNIIVASFLRKLAKQTLQVADGAVSLGGKLTPILGNNFEGAVEEIPVGIHERWRKSQPKERNDRPVFLFVGREDPVKGLDLFRKAAKHQKEAGFWVVGSEGKDTTNLKYYGPLYDESVLQKIYDRADFYVSCGYSEGMPIAILEAFSRGLPVIASDVGATTNLVNDKAGWLFDSGQQEELNKCIQKAINDTTYFKKSKIALEVSEKFTWEAVAEQHLKCFKEFI